MKVTINRETLLKDLKPLEPICNKRHSFSILQNVLFKARDGVLELTATDLNTTIILKEKDVTCSEEGACIILLKSLMSVASGMDKGINIDINSEKGIASIESTSAKASIPMEDISEYPEIDIQYEGKKATTISSIELSNAIFATAPFVAKDNSRHEFTGIYFVENDNEISIVSTDSHRLGKSHVCKPKDKETAFKDGKILPADGLTAMCKSIACENELRVYELKNKVVFETDSMCIALNEIGGQYPDFSKVFPTNCDHSVIVEKDTLIRIAKASGAFSSKSNLVKLEVAKGGLLYISASESKKGDIVHRMDCDYTGKGFVIGINWSYLCEAVSICQNDMIEISAIDSDYPLVIKSYMKESDFAQFIVMPMQL